MAIDLKAIREQCERATKGPWMTIAGLSDDNDPLIYRPVWVARAPNQPLIKEEFCVANPHREDWGAADAAFVAHAREDVPALLNIVATLIETIDGARAALESEGSAQERREAAAALAELVAIVRGTTSGQD